MSSTQTHREEGDGGSRHGQECKPVTSKSPATEKRNTQISETNYDEGHPMSVNGERPGLSLQ